MDPPRSGLDHPMKQAILEKRPHQILYVSCNPSTLAKDLADLRTDYKVDRIQPFDMFSQTQHVETVVSLRKIASNQQSKEFADSFSQYHRIVLSTFHSFRVETSKQLSPSVNLAIFI